MHKPIKFIYAALIITVIGAGLSWYMLRCINKEESILNSTAALQENNKDIGSDISIGHGINVSLKYDSDNKSINAYKGSSEIFSYSSSDPDLDVGLDDVEFLDVTFDGYKDIEINTFSGAYNFGYSLFAFNPETGMYETIPILEDIENYDFSEEDRTIHAHSKGRGLNDIYIDDLYEFRDGEYVLTRTETQDVIDFSDLSKGYENIVKEFKNGKMVETFRIHLSEKDVWGEE